MNALNILIAVRFFNSISFAQSYSQKADAVITETKSINSSDGRSVFSYCKHNPQIEFKDNLDYYWYNESSGVKYTKGGCGGKLLHGKEQFFDTEGNLVIDQRFYLGLRDGEFKEWD